MNNRTRAYLKISSVAVALLAITGGVIALAVYVFSMFNTPPPPDPKAAENSEVRDYLASNEFGGLSDDEKKAYLDQLRDEGKFRRRGPPREEGKEPTEEEKAQREKIRKNVGPIFRKQMEDRVKKYFDLPETDRVAYLDNMIDDMEQRRRERAAEREENGEPPPERKEGEGRGPGRGRDGRGPTPERMKQRIETTDPLLRAQMAEFREAMRNRVEERRAMEEALR